MDFLEACRRLIAVDSSPQAGSVAVMTEAAQLCMEAGLKVDIEPFTYNGIEQANLIARWGDEAPEGEFLLQSHLDTADAGPYSLWRRTGQNPFSATIQDGNIYGLGVADCKLDFVAKLFALLDVGPREKWVLPPVLVGTSAEELGLIGMMRAVRKNKFHPQKALVGEPTNLNFVYAAKGYLNVEIRLPFSDEEIRYKQNHDLLESSSTQSKMFRGKAAHSAAPEHGDNAIEKMLEYLDQLPEGIAIMEIEGGTSTNTVPGIAMVEFDIVPQMGQSAVVKLKGLAKAIERLKKDFTNFSDARFEPPGPTLNIGYIQSYTDHIMLAGSCRIPPVVPQEKYELWIKDLSEACGNIGATLRTVNYIRAYATDPETELIRSCLSVAESLDISAELVTQASIGEASVLSRRGVESISFGPGPREGSSHTADECISLKDLEVARKFYAECVRRFCL